MRVRVLFLTAVAKGPAAPTAMPAGVLVPVAERDGPARVCKRAAAAAVPAGALANAAAKALVVP
jgi:hypothetical protein